MDGKTHFFFGRQKDFIDFTIDHTSCSRVHAVMLYHQHLNRMFLLDLGSSKCNPHLFELFLNINRQII